jgi:glycosyltransferase involved in cell wall biosynthesis
VTPEPPAPELAAVAKVSLPARAVRRRSARKIASQATFMHRELLHATSDSHARDQTMKLSVYIVTLNEEERLANTLKAASQVADDILVVDSGSTDGTEEIARKYGARFIFNKWKNISSQKRFAQNQCLQDWVLSLDADEVLSEDLIGEIQEIKTTAETSSLNAYKIKITAMYPGDIKPRFFANHYDLVRLYNRKNASMPDDLTHDRVVLGEACRITPLKHEIHHFSYISLTKLWHKYNAYSDELVTTAIASGKRYSKLRLIFEFPVQFLRYYILRGQFLHGWWGFISAVTSAYFRFLKIAKYIEYQMTRGKEKT